MTSFYLLLLITVGGVLSQSESEFTTNQDTQHPIFPERGINGYIGVSDKPDDNQLFYWFFESRSDPVNDPLVFWFTGGPGCPGGLAMLFENGPFKFNVDKKTLINNPYSWNSNANIVFMDQPLGIGFSFGDESKYAKNADMVRDYMYEFMTKWLELDDFKRFKGHPFYIFGESYGGHYVPQISNKFYLSGNPDIYLKGIGIGNGWFSSKTQIVAYPEYAQATPGLNVSKERIDNGLKVGELSTHLVTQTLSPFIALNFDYLEDITTTAVIGDKKDFNVYNYKAKCVGDLCYDLSYISDFMNRPDVRTELKIPAKKGKWQMVNWIAGNLLNSQDHHTDSSLYLEPLLDGGVKVLIYTGVLDWICNWKGTEDVLSKLAWSGKVEWSQAEYTQCDYGFEKEVFNLRFVRVKDSGHMVPYDQPELALQLLNKFIHQ